MKNDLMIGRRFGRLEVLEYIGSRPRNQRYTYRGRILRLREYVCRCECGNECNKFGPDLRLGNINSCGCLKKEIQRKIHVGKIPVNRNKDPQMNTAREVWKNSYTDGLSFEDFLQLSQQMCHYCGCAPGARVNKINKSCSAEWYKAGWWTYNGVDRLDSAKNHTIENAVTCCWVCNRAKGNMSYNDFKTWVARCYSHFHQEAISDHVQAF